MSGSSVPSLGTTYTISAWIKTNTIGANKAFVAARSTSSVTPILFQLDQNNADARLVVRDDASTIATASFTSGLSVGKWYHVVGIRNGNSLSIYVNGVAGTPASNTLGTITTNSLNIGAITAGSATRSLFMDGLIDDVRIYNRALSAGEVTDLYNLGR